MVMVLAMSVTAFAAMPTSSGTLTIKVKENGNSLKGDKIFAFKLFDLTEVPDASESNYTYEVNEEYVEELKAVLALGLDADSYDIYEKIAGLSTETDPTIQKFANDFTKKVFENHQSTALGNAGTDYYTDFTVTENPADEAGKTATKTGVAPGYYLVYLAGSVQIQSSLKTVNGNTEIELKSDTPEAEKEAYDVDGSDQVNDTQIGDVVKYEVKVQIPDISTFVQDKYKFILHDELSVGLDFSNENGNLIYNEDSDSLPKNMSVNVKVGAADNTGSSQTAKLGGTDNNNARAMSLDLSDIVKNNQDKVGQYITVTYYAKVNAKADVSNTQNKAQIEYSNNPVSEEDTDTSIPDIEKTPTFPLDIHKYEEGKEDEFLGNVTFQLRTTAEDEGSAIKMTGINGNYTVADPQSDGNANMNTYTDEITEGSLNNLHINGLKAGTYYLVETNAPDGFHKAEPIKIVITNTTHDNGTVTWTIKTGSVNTSDGELNTIGDKVIDVINKKGTILPGTGGMGTMIFTAVGVILILGVGASFVVSRRRNEA